MRQSIGYGTLILIGLLLLPILARCTTQTEILPTITQTPIDYRTPTIPATPSPVPSSTPTAEPTESPTPTKPAPPKVHLQLPDQVKVGTEYILELSLEEPDGDEISLTVEQVQGMGDRYKGNEYVTSQSFAELSLENRSIRFLTDTPGNYRIQIIAEDKDGATTINADIHAFWPLGENPFAIRGVAIDFWGPPTRHNLNAVPQLIEVAKEHGANFVQIAPNWHAESADGSAIVNCSQSQFRPLPCVTPKDEVLIEWIEHAHSLDMQVLIKPHLMVGNFDQATGYEADMWQIRPRDPEEWFRAYNTFLLHYARISEGQNVEMLSIGNELMGTLRYRQSWMDLIQDVREVYSGELTYSNVDLWTNGPTIASFWDDLDYIGIPYYFPGSRSDPKPAVDEMADFITNAQSGNLSYVVSRYETPLLATEMGRPNFDGTNYEPWDWSDREIDNQELVDWAEAAFQTQLSLTPRFRGTFVWVLKPRFETYEMDWDFRDKPLMDALQHWYSN